MGQTTSTALATIEKIDDVTVTSSGLPNDLMFTVPTVEDCNAMPEAAFHTKLQAVLIGSIACHEAAKNFIVSAKLRLQNGETVGGCTKLTGEGGYIDRYIRKPCENLSVAVRRTYRLLDGVGVDTKFDSSQERARLKAVEATKRKRIADKKADQEARARIDAAVEKNRIMAAKSNAQIIEAAFDLRSEDAVKQTVSLQKQIVALNQKIRDMEATANAPSKVDKAVDELVELIFQNITPQGKPNFSVHIQRKICTLAERIRLYKKGNDNH